MLSARSGPVQKRDFLVACLCITPVQSGASPIQYFFRFFHWVPFQCYTDLTEETALQVAERTPFEAKWRLLARVGVRCYILISSVSGAVKVAPLQILQFPVILPHKFQDAEKFNLQFSDFSEITETADKLRWLRYQKGLRQRDVADYAGIDRSTYVHYEEYGKDLYPPEHMEKIAQLFEVPVETLLDMNLVGPNSARNI